MNNLKVWLKGARLYTLPIGIVPVIMAISIFARYLFSGQILVKPYNIENFVIQSLLCIGVAAFMQISANYANDYCDGLRGLDDQRSNRDLGDKTLCDVSWRLADAGIKPKSVLYAVCISALVSCVFGLIITVRSGIWIFILLGLVCLMGAWFYAGGSHPYGYRGWGEFSAFLFFGPVAFLGTLCALSFGSGFPKESITTASVPQIVFCVLLSIIPGGFSACLMMINNLRDIESDTKHKKITAMAWLGKRKGGVVFTCVAVLVAILQSSYVLLYVFDSRFIGVFLSINNPHKTVFALSNILFNQGVFIVCCILLLLLTYMFIKKAYSLAYAVICGNYANAFPICVSLAMLGSLTFVLSIFAC
ncbi:1,4-dihydroxy-2-naphthoate octaprenyltransferase [Gardnerella vaginalis]|nr:1,4-dihydroxy-2-naphthoate octaprenyltransferase [Gardnerella vaginalis]